MLQDINHDMPDVLLVGRCCFFVSVQLSGYPSDRKRLPKKLLQTQITRPTISLLYKDNMVKADIIFVAECYLIDADDQWLGVG